MGTSMVIRTTATQVPEQVQVGGKKKKCETASHLGIWSRMAKASSMPTAVSTLLSITPIGGQMKPPTIRSIERIRVMRNVRMVLRF